MRGAAAIVVAAALAAGCGGDDALLEPRWSPPSNDLGLAADVVEGVTTATTVRAQRVHGVPEDMFATVNVGDPVTVPASLVAELQRVIGTKRYTIPPSCVFEPGITLTFDGGTRPVELVLCFHCDQILVRRAGGPGDILSFRPQRPAFAALARALLPDDAEIQALR